MYRFPKNRNGMMCVQCFIVILLSVVYANDDIHSIVHSTLKDNAEHTIHTTKRDVSMQKTNIESHYWYDPTNYNNNNNNNSNHDISLIQHVHEYKGIIRNMVDVPTEQNLYTLLLSSSSNNEHDMIPNQHQQQQQSIIVQYYTSNLHDGGTICMDMKDHFVQLAKHVHEITTTSTIPKIDHLKQFPKQASTDDQQQQHHVSFHTINCAIYSVLCQQHKITSYPTFRMIQSQNDHRPINLSHQHLHPYEILERLGITESNNIIDETDIIEDATMNEMIMNQFPAIDNNTNNNNVLPPQEAQQYSSTMVYHHRVRQELLHDIEIAIHDTFRYVIFHKEKHHPTIHIPKGRRSELSITEQDVLKPFLMLIHRTLPSTATSIQAILKSVIDGYMYATKNHEYMHALLQEHLPMSSSQYSDHACPTYTTNDNLHPVQKQQSKYTCVMWDLLLMVSAGMVDYNQQSYDATEMIHPATALHTIYEYVQTFGLQLVKSGLDDPISSSSIQQPMITDDRDQDILIQLYNNCTFMNRCSVLPDAPKIVYENKRDQISKEVIAQITTSYNEWIMVPLYIAAMRDEVVQQYDTTTTITTYHWPSPQTTCSLCWIIQNTMMRHDDENLYKFLKIEYGHVDSITTQYRQEMYNTSSSMYHSRDSPINDKRTFTKSNINEISTEEGRKSNLYDSIQYNSTSSDFTVVTPLHASRVSIQTVFIYLLLVFVIYFIWKHVQQKHRSISITNDLFSNRSNKSRIISNDTATTSFCAIANNFDDDSNMQQHDKPKSPSRRSTKLKDQQQRNRQTQPQPLVSMMEHLEDQSVHVPCHNPTITSQIQTSISSTPKHTKEKYDISLVDDHPVDTISSSFYESPKTNPSKQQQDIQSSKAGHHDVLLLSNTSLSPNGLSVSLSSQLRRRLPTLPITNS